MASSSKKNHDYLYAHVKNGLVLLIMIGAIIMMFYMFVMMLHLILMPCLHLALHMLMVEIGLGVIMLCLMRLGEIAIVLILSIMLAMLLLYFQAKMQK